MEIRKAEMEAKKVENMILHKDEIYSRPKRTWFTTEKEKKFVAKASKEALVNKKGSKIEKFISAEDAEKLRMKEKRKHGHERNLPRKKRRKLEAAREMLEDAKAVDAATKAVDAAAGKIVKNCVKKSRKHHPSQQITRSRREERQELFHHDIGEKKRLKRTTFGVGGKNKSFKSKSSRD
ncbi:hypothetical protein OROHE_022763 [Orobanche hederae]